MTGDIGILPPSAIVAGEHHLSGRDLEKDDPVDSNPEKAELNDVPPLQHDRNRPVLPVVAPCSPEPAGPSKWSLDSIRSWLEETVDTDGATGPLAAFCFMTVRF